MINTFSYGTITEEDVKETRTFAANALRKLKKLKTKKEQQAYLFDLLHVNEEKPAQPKSSSSAKKRKSKD